jgi:hypothetical protein
MRRKAFTVEEANALVPVMEQVVEEIERRKEFVRERHENLEILDVMWGGSIRETENPDHEEFLQNRRELDDAIGGIRRIIQHEIFRRGIRFPPGGLENGLLDFPTTYDGRWVYLCWRYGEPGVLHWHEIDAGFQGRREITEEHVRRMGKDDPAHLDDSMLDF